MPGIIRIINPQGEKRPLLAAWTINTMLISARSRMIGMKRARNGRTATGREHKPIAAPKRFLLQVSAAPAVLQLCRALRMRRSAKRGPPITAHARPQLRWRSRNWRRRLVALSAASLLYSSQ